jgi:pyrroloquinoline quinone (PQQ) biosynthesis protein C
MSVKFQTTEVNMMEQLDYPEHLTKASIVLPSQSLATNLLAEGVRSSQQLNSTPLESSPQLLTNDAVYIVSDEVAVKTANRTWEHQPINNQHSVTDPEAACFVSDATASKTTNYTWAQQPKLIKRSAVFPKKKADAGSKAKTQQLLDGAVAYAWSRVKSRSRPPALTPTRWVWRLASSYHLTHSTPRLMEEAAQRFNALGRKSLMHWALEKSREEAGHDRLALLDIQSMGYNAEAVVKALVPSTAAVLLDYFTRSVQAIDPIGCVGYSYTMERLALGIGKDYIQRVENILPPNINATRCLRVHSSVGSDVEHVDETVDMMAEVTPEDRARVARACYETAMLCFSPPKQDYISEEELQKLLKPLELKENDGLDPVI